MIRLIPQVFNHRQLFRQHLRGNLLHQFSAGNLMRQSGDDDSALFLLIDSPHFYRATAVEIHFLYILGGRDNFSVGRVIGAFDEVEQVIQGAVRLIQ